MEVLDIVQQATNRSTLLGRWSSLGPYYAMFPVEFAFKVISEYCKEGGAVLDPFCGRGTSIYAAAALGRTGTGIEINPVGWVYSKAKLGPANENNVKKRLQEIYSYAPRYWKRASDLPEFFHHAYSRDVNRFLLSARDCLDWKGSKVDRTLMAVILVYLHGKAGSALSNQMRQTKAMAPEYSVNWWKERGMHPPEIDVVEFLTQRIEWRFQKGIPQYQHSNVLIGDSKVLLPRINKDKKYDLLLTSPPYCGITNYYYDQWIRNWLLGGPDVPQSTENWHSKYASKKQYEELIRDVFGRSKRLLNKSAVIYVRTDARKFTKEITRQVLEEIYPDKKVQIKDSPLKKLSQTALFGDLTQKPGEVDIILK